MGYEIDGIAIYGLSDNLAIEINEANEYLYEGKIISLKEIKSILLASWEKQPLKENVRLFIRPHNHSTIAGIALLIDEIKTIPDYNIRIYYI